MKITVLVDIDSEKKDGQIRVFEVVTEGEKVFEAPEENQGRIVEQMSALCEGICTLIHEAERLEINPSWESLQDCITHLQNGFSDASYKTDILLRNP